MCPPSPSFTYTLTNGTTADADQVMQNFNDLLNGITDGTKDISVSALTAAGTATLNGAVTLGNATADDITVTGSLASTVPIKTTNTYDIGSSTKGLAGVYFGANSQTVRLLGSSSMSATWSMTLPVTAGTAGYSLVTNGSGVTSWSKEHIGTATNDDATAGYVGEYLEQVILSGSAVSLTTSTAKSLATITLTPGDWDVTGHAFFVTTATTSVTRWMVATSFTDNTLPSAIGPANGEVEEDDRFPATVYGAVGNSRFIPTVRVKVAVNTPIYFVLFSTFTASTQTAYGGIWARRAR